MIPDILYIAAAVLGLLILLEACDAGARWLHERRLRREREAEIAAAVAAWAQHDRRKIRGRQ